MSILKWLGGSSDRFNDPGNWKPQRAPSSTSDVVIEPSSPTTIVETNDAINSLVTNANATLAVAATGMLEIFDLPDAANPYGASTIGGTLSLGQLGELFLDGQVTNEGVLGSGHGSDIIVRAGFTNSGAVDQSGDLTLGNGTQAGTLINSQGATWSINGDANVDAAFGSSLTNAGTLTRSGTGVSDIVGLSTINFGSVSVTSGELDFLHSPVLNTGTMTATHGTLILDDPVTGVGKLDLGAGGALTLVGGPDAGQTVDFLGNNATLDLLPVGDFGGHISGFGAHDLIDLADAIVNHKSFAGGVLTLSDGSTPVAHLNFNGAYSPSSFSLSTDHNGGTLIHFV